MAGYAGGLGQIEVVSSGTPGIFLDRFKAARVTANNLELASIDVHSLPKAMPSAGKQLQYSFDNPKHGKNIKIWWDGTLDWTIGNATIVSSAANYKIIKPGVQDNILMTLKSFSVAPTYIHAVDVDQEANFLAGEYLTPEFIADMTYLKPGEIRFMNSASGSGSTALYSTQITTEADVCGWGEGYKFSHTTDKIATAVKDANTAIDEYDLTVPVWAGADGDTCYLQITPALKSTTLGTTYHAMRISINGGPRKPCRIWNQLSEYFFDVQKFRDLNGAYTVASVRYDAVFDCYIVKGGQISESPWIGADKGSIPYSMMAKICTRFGAHCHFTLPALAADRGTSAIQAACEEVQANLGPGLVAYPEIGNEIWNGNRGFFNTQYAIKWHNQRFGKNYTVADAGYGYMMAVAAPIIHAAFGGDRNRYQLSAGLKTFQDIPSTTGTERINATDAVTLGGKTSPVGYVAEAKMATYYNSDRQPPGVNPSATNKRWINMLYYAKKHRDAVATGDTVTAAKAVRWLVDGTLDANAVNSQLACRDQIEKNGSRLLAKYPGIMIGFYEGGYSAQNITAEPTVNVTGVDPDGNSVTYSGVQPVGTKDMFNALVRASRMDDKKLAWLAFQWYRYWHDKPGYRFPSRYGWGSSGVLGDWAARPKPTDNFDQDAEGFAAFSNGDSIMLMTGV